MGIPFREPRKYFARADCARFCGSPGAQRSVFLDIPCIFLSISQYCARRRASPGAQNLENTSPAVSTFIRKHWKCFLTGRIPIRILHIKMIFHTAREMFPWGFLSGNLGNTSPAPTAPGSVGPLEPIAQYSLIFLAYSLVFRSTAQGAERPPEPRFLDIFPPPSRFP